MNARMPQPASGARAPDVGPAELARELREAGEALVRAAAAIASFGERTTSMDRQEAPSHRGAVALDERLSGRQLGAIRAASRRAGLSRDALTQLLDQMTGKQEASTLTRVEASGVLDRLSAMTGYHR